MDGIPATGGISSRPNMAGGCRATGAQLAVLQAGATLLPCLSDIVVGLVQGDAGRTASSARSTGSVSSGVDTAAVASVASPAYATACQGHMPMKCLKHNNADHGLSNINHMNCFLHMMT